MEMAFLSDGFLLPIFSMVGGKFDEFSTHLGR